jgi:Ca2+-binding EF-hand superfamily protein
LYGLLDGDGDHVVSAAELAKFDKDGDKALDVHELMGMLRAVGFDADDDVTDFARMVMSAAGDTDGDGRLTLAEINAAAVHLQ